MSITCKNVSMTYNIATEKIDTLKEYILRTIKFQHSSVHKFVALNNVSFSLKQGESVGIIGENGSGKSTLLKLIAGVMSPTEGNIYRKGVIAPLIELGAGFDMELTARENIFFNGALLGYSRKFMQEHLFKIITFAELENFLDVPVKNFSSGMVARLAFSLATFVKPDILIVDEVLGVGDAAFQKKSTSRIQELLKQNLTLLLVSHDENAVRANCQKAIWLNGGKVACMGLVNDVLKEYNANLTEAVGS